eukprot:1161270-Pelagomonas_calceolata.AAC.4
MKQIGKGRSKLFDKDKDGVVCQMCAGCMHGGLQGAMRHLKSHCKKLKEGQEVVIEMNQEHGPCILECESCSEVMSPNNPLQAAQLFMQAPLQGGG